MNSVFRPKVLWFGPRDGRPDDIEFKRRDLHLEIINRPPTLDDLRYARAIIFSAAGSTMTACKHAAVTTSRLALDHGVQPYVIAENGTAIDVFQSALHDAGVDDLVRYHGNPDDSADWRLAQLCAGLEPKGLYSPTLRIEVLDDDPALSEDEELLLRLAFGKDGKSISVKRLSGGLQAKAFMIGAVFEGSAAGPLPLPYFVKIGTVAEIRKEQICYRIFANGYVPFYLRPNLDGDRCLASSRQGILVGDFVDRAVTLWEAVEEGRFEKAIGSLFEVTLGGWRAQGLRGEAGRQSRPVADAIGTTRVNTRRFRDEHIVRARELGAERSPDEIWTMLLGLRQQCNIGPMHGDLHPDNVFVRGDDAVLIDLASTQLGPISGDPACLEIFLTFFHRTGREDGLSFDDWRKDVDRLYAPSAFGTLPSVTGDTRWLRRCAAAMQVRAISLATQACHDEHMAAVASFLLRRAMHPASAGDAIEADRRAYAIVVAERLAVHMQGGADDNAN